MKKKVPKKSVDEVFEIPDLTEKKVRINVEQIESRGESAPAYKAFLKKNDGKVFTAVPHGNTTTLYELTEDLSNPKWVFWWEDLIVVEE